LLGRSIALAILTTFLWARPSDDVLPYQTTSFRSSIDGNRDIYAFAPSRELFAPDKTILMVYLHGLGQNHSEPFRQPLHGSFADCLFKEFPNLEILSCNYGILPSWCKSTVRQDISLNIRQALKEHPAEQIIVTGSSMGACSALTYVACAPKDIKDKIAGVIAIYPSGDLMDLHNNSSADVVKNALEKAFDGGPDRQSSRYKDSSLNGHLNTFPSKARVCVIEGAQDTIVPVAQQKDVVRALSSKGVGTQVIEIAGNHQPPPGKLIVTAMNYVLGSSPGY
jgi:hypothetical protein